MTPRVGIGPLPQRCEGNCFVELLAVKPWLQLRGSKLVRVSSQGFYVVDGWERERAPMKSWDTSTRFRSIFGGRSSAAVTVWLHVRRRLGSPARSTSDDRRICSGSGRSVSAQLRRFRRRLGALMQPLGRLQSSRILFRRLLPAGAPCVAGEAERRETSRARDPGARSCRRQSPVLLSV